MKYFICGFMGAGKTTLLKELAPQIEDSYELVDLDEYIFENFGKEFESLGAFIDSIGMEHFRALEFSALMNLSVKDRLIVALGGGSLTVENQALLASWSGYWLDVGFGLCWSRICDDTNRPMVKLGEEALHSLYIARSEIYSNYTRVKTVQDFLEKTAALRN